MSYRGQNIGESQFIKAVIPPATTIKEATSSLYKLLSKQDVGTLGPNTEKLLLNSPNENAFWDEDRMKAFLKYSLIDPGLLLTLIQNSPSRVLNMVEQHLTVREVVESSSSSRPSVCSQIDQYQERFSAIIGNAKALAGKFEEIYSKISDGGLVNEAKSMAESMVKAEINEVKSKLESITGIFGALDIDIPERIASKILKKREEVEAMTTDDVIQDLIDSVKGQVAYIIDQFKEVKAEESLHIVKRICSMTSDMMKPVNDRLDEVRKMSEGIQSTKDRLNFVSSENTNRAVASGAYRIPPPEIKRQAIQFRGNIQTTIQAENTEAYYPPPIENVEVGDVTPWNNGNGDARIGFQNKLGGMGEEGWIRVDVRVKVLLMRLQAMYGERLMINSAYRSPSYNRRVGGAPKSTHMSGKALDISFESGYSTPKAERLISLAKQIGFHGIGRYPGKRFTHIDIASKREWRG